MLECLLWLVFWIVVAAIVVYVIETALKLLGTVPSQVYVLIRLLFVLLLLLWLLHCAGVLSGAHGLRGW